MIRVVHLSVREEPCPGDYTKSAAMDLWSSSAKATSFRNLHTPAHNWLCPCPIMTRSELSWLLRPPETLKHSVKEPLIRMTNVRIDRRLVSDVTSLILEFHSHLMGKLRIRSAIVTSSLSIVAETSHLPWITKVPCLSEPTINSPSLPRYAVSSAL